MNVLALCLAAVLLAATGGPREADAYCDICNVRNDHTLDWSKPLPGLAGTKCEGYQDSACCSVDTATKIGTGQLYGGSYRYDRCDGETDTNTGNTISLSDACRNFFDQESCFYECDVNVGKFRASKDCDDPFGAGWQIVGMPIKASYCDAWYEACKDDFICACAPGDTSDTCSFNPLSYFALPDIDCSVAAGTCQKFSDVFGVFSNPGQKICEDMWDAAFVYTDDQDYLQTHGVHAYTMDVVAGTPNPNHATLNDIPHIENCPNHTPTEALEAACQDLESHPTIDPHDCHVCQVRNGHTLELSGPATSDLGFCHAYAENTCCSAETAAGITAREELYSAAYRPDRCYQDGLNGGPSAFPSKCWEWFQAENCLYECDVNIGKFRKHDDCGTNSWQIDKMPIRASECDAWFDDCKDAKFCTCGLAGTPACPEGATAGSLFSLPDLGCSAEQCAKTFGEIYGDGKTFCEALWDNSFHYEEVERHAYSMAWIFDQSTNAYENPNNKVRTVVLEFDENCPGFEATEDACPTTEVKEEYCDICNVRNDHTLDWAKPVAAAELAQWTACKGYADSACCSTETVNKIGTGQLYGDDYKWDRCNGETDPDGETITMSQECANFFIEEECFYECDVNVGKYRKHKTCDASWGAGWQIHGMPIQAGYCDAWLAACRNDYVCACAPGDTSSACANPLSFFARDGMQCTVAAGTCQKFGDVYTSGKEVCEDMWDFAFVYTHPHDNLLGNHGVDAYTMRVEEGAPNPNHGILLDVAHLEKCPEHTPEEELEAACADLLLHPNIDPHDCHVCKVRNDHTLDVSAPATGDLGVCAGYSDNACCPADFTAKISDLARIGELYSDQYNYRWDRCYENGMNGGLSQFPQRCHRWFQAENCLYECDVNIGKYRIDDTCDNAWQIFKMPIKASECDAWFEDCRDVKFCTCGTATTPPCPESWMSPGSLFNLEGLACGAQQCTETFGDIFADSKEFCELLWDNAFHYEPVERHAYSMGWILDDSAPSGFKSATSAEDNPNNYVRTVSALFDANCPSHDATESACEVESESDGEDQNNQPGDQQNNQDETPGGGNDAPGMFALSSWMSLGVVLALLFATL